MDPGDDVNAEISKYCMLYMDHTKTFIKTWSLFISYVESLFPQMSKLQLLFIYLFFLFLYVFILSLSVICVTLDERMWEGEGEGGGVMITDCMYPYVKMTIFCIMQNTNKKK